MTRRRSLISACVAALAVVLAGCGDDDGPPNPTRTTLGLVSSAFLEGSRIPARYTCDGDNSSPPLSWTRVPVRARSLALIVEDQDAPAGVLLHWSLYDLARGSTGLKPGKVPSGTAEGQNSFGNARYDGPCPPEGGGKHRYRFRLYALDDAIGLEPGASPEAVRAAIAQHAITTGSLTGLYSR